MVGADQRRFGLTRRPVLYDLDLSAANSTIIKGR